MDASPPQRLALIIEGFKPDKANHLYCVFRSFFSHLRIIVHEVNLEGLALSLLGSGPREKHLSELTYRETFIHLLSLLGVEPEHFIFVCDSLTEPYERRERYFRSGYSIETNAIFILESAEIPAIRSDLGVRPEYDYLVREVMDKFAKVSLSADDSVTVQALPPGNSIKERVTLANKKYLEKLSLLLGELKKRAMLYRRTKISQGIYLYSRYSTLYLLHTGYTLFFVYKTSILDLVMKILSKTSTKKKWTIYLATYHKLVHTEEKKDRRKESFRSLKTENKFKKDLRGFCEKERIGQVLYPGDEIGKETVSQLGNISQVEAPCLAIASESRVRDTIETLLLLEGMDKTLVVSSVPVIKLIMCHLKRVEPSDVLKQSVPLHAVIKLSLKNSEVVEKKYFITKLD